MSYALGRLRTGEMNKTEQAYADLLELKRRAGEIKWYLFEGIKLRLADKTFYSPDFVVMNDSTEIELHEVKGFMMDDAAVKIKVAAATFPFRFFLIRKAKGGSWNITEIGSHE